MISLDTYVDKSVLEQAEYEKSRRVLFEIAPVNMTEENRVQRYVCVSFVLYVSLKHHHGNDAHFNISTSYILCLCSMFLI